jgi:hypothetical protein
MSKKLINRIVIILSLLLFISSQGINFSHSHKESEDKNTCEHSGNDTHIHNKHTDKCEICQHNYHSTIFYFQLKTIHFYKQIDEIVYSENKDFEIENEYNVYLRGPPLFFV